MRKLTWLVVILACLWGGYWFAGSQAIKFGTQFFLETDQNFKFKSASVHGFPNRFDLTLKEPKLDDGYRTVWEAPYLQLFTLSYKPWHLIAAFPPEQRINWKGIPATLHSGKMQASIKIKPNRDLTLNRIVVAADQLRLEGDNGFNLAVAALNFGTRKVDETGTRHEIGLKIADMIFDPQLAEAIGLPPVVENVHIDVIAGFSAPWDRKAFDRRPPKLQTLDLKALSVTWGEMALKGESALRADDAGRAEGEMTFTITNLSKVIDLAVSLGMIPEAAAPGWREQIARFTTPGANANETILTVTFAGGLMSIGGLPIGPAPRF